MTVQLRDIVKLDLGITHRKKDRDIDGAIAAACLDLSNAGVSANRTDPLIQHAVKLFCRSWYNYQGMAEQWNERYEAQKRSLALSGKHREEPGDEE